MKLEVLRMQVLEAAQQMVRDGLAYGSGGNISAQDPDSGLIAITPSAIEYSHMTAEDVVVIDEFGKSIEGKWKPTSETPMHTIFYREREDVGAVVHTHAPYVSVYAISGESIPMVVTESALCIGAPVEIAPYARPGTEELAQIVLKTMGSGVSVIMAQHGMIAVGPNLHAAYGTTIATEVSARLTIMARSAGMQPITIDLAEVKELRQIYLEHYHPTQA
jgi:L-ribulose-5-phosphate 4-epimerase